VNSSETRLINRHQIAVRKLNQLLSHRKPIAQSTLHKDTVANQFIASHATQRNT